ncbi:MAG: hypothetical protein ACKOBF_09015 [Limnohabitans sp.]
MANFITSAGDICEPYECMDLITAYKSGEGNFDYQGALAFLVDHAKKSGADGVIHVNFNERSAVGTKKVCFQDQTVTIFEVRVWGTMIKLKN